MDYRHLVLGAYYLFEGQRYRLVGLRLHVWPEEKAWAAILIAPGQRLSVKPQDLQELPDEQ